ncbi:MAG: c-type cytochrome [Caldilineaceae bacterium]|nr:c-type cytochrome [Caldilineaceae bacterium]
MNETPIFNRFGNFALYGALLTAWVATLGSLYFSEVRHFLPCALCWYQRILMYPLALLLAVGLLRRDRHLAYLVLPFSIFGQGISTYHYLLEKTTLFGAPTACGTGVSCTIQWINWFGFVTIPFLAMIAFMMITVFCVIAIYRGELTGENERIPWQPVTVIVGVVMIVFIVLGQTTAPVVAQTESEFVLPTIAENPAAFTPVEPIAADPALIAEGRQLFQQACAACHGTEGQGVTHLGVSLNDSELVLAHEAPEVIEMIRVGRWPGDPANTSGGVMPPSGGRPDLTDDQLLAIVAYLRSNATGASSN